MKLLALLAILAVAPDEVEAIVARLAGHTVRVADDRRAIEIVDIAGEGAPRIGVVAREGEALWLIADDGRWRLTGPLARPRIAGPGYTVWVIGDVEGDELRARRLGILRRPARLKPRG